MQSPESKFHAVVFSALIPVIVFGVAKLAPLLAPWSTGGWILGVVAGTIASAGLYTTIAQLLSALLRRIAIVRRFVLGASHLHGTWVGWFMGHSKEVRLIVEVIEQDLTSLCVRGASFTADGLIHGLWISEATLIDAEAGRYIYTSRSDVIASATPYQSISVFHMVRDDPTKPPFALEGFATDLHAGIRLPVRENKVSEKLLDYRVALDFARAAYERDEKRL